MSRKPSITRTIVTEDVTISAANEQSGRVQALTVTIPAGSKTDLERLRVIRPQLQPHIQPLRVVKVASPETHIYRMSIPDLLLMQRYTIAVTAIRCSRNLNTL